MYIFLTFWLIRNDIRLKKNCRINCLKVLHDLVYKSMMNSCEGINCKMCLSSFFLEQFVLNYKIISFT